MTDIFGDKSFEEKALAIFHKQAAEVPVYTAYLEKLKISAASVKSIEEIPFLPVSFFKTHRVTAGGRKSELVFTSSGTTGNDVSRHFVTDPLIYINSFTKGFELFYGDIKRYCFLALLPGYLEREGSSLVYMCAGLIKRSQHHLSGFYLDKKKQLTDILYELHEKKQPVILLGVSYALLDIAAEKLNLPGLIVIETGGMKGKRKEMVREELHAELKTGFGVDSIHSEYGMTELLSQAWSRGSGLFQSPPWMRILIRDVNDPFQMLGSNAAGGVNIIDLANYNSCSFIATQDIGKINDDGSFEVLGRMDNSDLRGCNLLVS